MNWDDFWYGASDFRVKSNFYESERRFTVEELYQAFKERMLKEMAESWTSPSGIDPDKFVADMLSGGKCCVCGGPFHGISRCPRFVPPDQPGVTNGD